ncbi:uncharacterized protein A4U43_C06F7960 [Asparagus officinalis]|uniref:BURP domain-containing protein n=1 Tax=Asparagus officinalis TaxID=4686 RepID=A0A5P1EL85_ASPOF|nr:uncharacterized protein A4U43_C06F7960 [Asparagus officinalis]
MNSTQTLINFIGTQIGERFCNIRLESSDLEHDLIEYSTWVVAASHESLTAQVYWNKALPKTLVPGAIKDFLHPVKIEGHHASSSFGYRPVLEEDMLSGTKVKMHFMRTTAGSGATFLSRQAATTIPFSSASLPAILTHFSVNPNSVTASHSRKPYTSAEKACYSRREQVLCYVP